MLNRLEMLRIFCTAAESHNFKEAAQRLGISPQTVTRAIQELESQLGELLFHRNTRQSQITQYGEQLAIEASKGLAGIDRLFHPQSESIDQEIRGVVRITAPEVLGQDYLVPQLAQLQQRHPSLCIDLRLSDKETNVVDEQIDIGLRLGFMRDSRFVARVIAQIPFYIVGAPSLIQRVGIPRSLQELAAYPVTGAIDRDTGKPWPWFLAQGQQWQPEQPVFLSNDTRAECKAIMAGFGFGQIVSFMAIPLIRSGHLTALLNELAPAPWNLNLYRPQRQPVPARIRVVYDWLEQAFSDPLFFPQSV